MKRASFLKQNNNKAKTKTKQKNKTKNKDGKDYTTQQLQKIYDSSTFYLWLLLDYHGAARAIYTPKSTQGLLWYEGWGCSAGNLKMDTQIFTNKKRAIILWIGPLRAKSLPKLLVYLFLFGFFSFHFCFLWLFVCCLFCFVLFRFVLFCFSNLFSGYIFFRAFLGDKFNKIEQT